MTQANLTTDSETQMSRLMARLRPMIPEDEPYVGQDAVEAFADALALDTGAVLETATGLANLSDACILEGARNFSAALRGVGEPFNLPSGTRVSIGRPGSVEIAGRAYVRRRSVPGLHLVEATPRDAHGDNFESLRLMVYNRGSSSSCRHIGLPSPAFIGDGGVQYLIEFPPFMEAGGAVLTYRAEDIDAARFCAAPLLSLEKVADAMVKGTQWLWRRRNIIGNLVQEARQAAVAGIKVAYGGGCTVALDRICIDARTIAEAEGPTLRLEYLGYDDALRRGRLLVVARKDEFAGGVMLRAPRMHARRKAQIEQLRKLRADGWIDELAAAIARAAPEGQAAVLLRLSRDLETPVAIPTAYGPFHATLYWRDGVIRADANNPTADLVGNTLSDVADLPFAYDCAFEREAKSRVCDPSDCLQAAVLLVNTATGAIWTGPHVGD